MGQLSEQAYRVLIIINASLAAAQLEITFWSRFRSCLAPPPYSPTLLLSLNLLPPPFSSSLAPSPAVSFPFLPPLSPSGAFCVLKCLQHGYSRQQREGQIEGGCAGCCVGVAKSNQTAMSAWHVISKKEAKNQKEQPQNVTKRIENRSKESERSEKFKLPFGWWKTFAQVLAVFGFIFEWILVAVCVCKQTSPAGILPAPPYFSCSLSNGLTVPSVTAASYFQHQSKELAFFASLSPPPPSLFITLSCCCF